MKIAAVFLMFCITTLAVAQDVSILNTGFDLMIFSGKTMNESGMTNYSSKGGVFLEKPFRLGSSEKLFLSPGFSYKSINEKYQGGGMGGALTSELNHSSLSGYIKLIRKTKIIKISPAVLYFGGFAGFNMYTRAKGKTSSYNVFYFDANWEDRDFYEEPSHLFKKVYGGILTGVEFKNHSFIQPSVEIKFLPNYGRYRGKVLNPFEVGINLAFASKKTKSQEKPVDEKQVQPEN